MGDKNATEFVTGTIIFGDGEPIPVKSVSITEVASNVDGPFEYVKRIDTSAEFTCTIEMSKITFRTKVMLFGFWKAVRFEIKHIFKRREK